MSIGCVAMFPMGLVSIKELVLGDDPSFQELDMVVAVVLDEALVN